LAKTDIANAYGIAPIHPDDRRLLGFSWPAADGKNYYYQDACLTMGLSMSCQLFTRFSNALQWAMKDRLKANMSHIIDDFLFVGPIDSDLCQPSLEAFIDMVNDIGIPIKHEKTTLPSSVITIYGIEVDSVSMIAILSKIAFFMKKKKVTLKSLQSLLGLLNFAASCIVPGRIFLRRLYDLTVDISFPHFKIRLTNEAKADLAVWYSFLQSFNGKCMFLNDIWTHSHILHLFTDAAFTAGFAAVFGSQSFAEAYPDTCKNYHINILELLPIVLAVEFWGFKMANQ
jgi:hypothetical protein